MGCLRIDNRLTIRMFCAFFSLQIMETLCFCDQCNLSWVGFTHHYEALSQICRLFIIFKFVL
jgi:hypothetical protein